MKHFKMLLLLVIIFIASLIVRLYLNYEEYKFTNWRDDLFFSFWITIGLLIFYLLQLFVQKHSNK